MLRSCALTYETKWEDSLPCMEFSYNNSYQTILKMSPFEGLYGRKCRNPLNRSLIGDSHIFGIDLMLEAKKQVKVIQDSLRATQSCQKSYYDAKHHEVALNPESMLIFEWRHLKD